MNAQLKSFQQWYASNAGVMQGAAAPMLVVAILAMMVLPLPPLLLDMFFTINIAVALMVMMVAAYMIRPLDFAAFPSVLLLTTLMRLSLNVASTRVVLLEGHTGPGAAGAVIEAFGHFLIGGNFAVGLIVFAILVVINFVVVTKGSERIAEVSARFTLDAMPGKQMAIDADLNAGLINEAEAKQLGTLPRNTETAPLVQQWVKSLGAISGDGRHARLTGDQLAQIGTAITSGPGSEAFSTSDRAAIDAAIKRERFWATRADQTDPAVRANYEKASRETAKAKRKSTSPETQTLMSALRPISR